MLTFLRSLDTRGLWAGLGLMGLVALGILAGSRGLRDYDLALLPYTFGVLFASFAVAYRYAVWIQRPATNVYWSRGWQLIFRKGDVVKNLLFLARSVYDNLFAQKFIRRRNHIRWIAHFCFAWGCVIAAAVTFPLVFGWIHFETRLADPHWYRVVVFGTVVDEFHTASLKRYVMFNLLNLSAVLVIVGVGLALHRRLKDAESLARQQFGNDIVPLILLFAISITGLMLTFSMHALHGYGYPFISLVHAIVVTGTLLYLPFGKFFHIFQRPAQLSVTFYRQANAASAPAVCATCGEGFAGSMHVQDLKEVLHDVDLDWKLDGPVRHYSDVCPRCRRRFFGFTQGRLLGRAGNVSPLEDGDDDSLPMAAGGGR
jgi:nitrate reductase gamma subunit